MTTGQRVLVRLGGPQAVGLFVVCLLAFVAETQLSQYVQADLGFRQPYLLFYIVHSSFALSLPLHILLLSATTKHSIRSLYKSLLVAIQQHLSPESDADGPGAREFPTWKLMRLCGLLTLGMTLPSLFWFIAVVLAPLTDVTALWNTNAFFAYVFAVLISGVKWDVRRLIAVLIATTGALVVVYGSSGAEVDEGSPASLLEGEKAPLVGDLLTLAASIMYGAYQVLYKMYAALPDDPEVQIDGHYAPLAVSPEETVDGIEDGPTSPLLSREETSNPPPFGLYPNMLTSAIGLCTLCTLWIPIPILHFLDIEPFALPHRAVTYGVIAGIALSGSIFNAGFMVLMGLWGPIVTSVGSLLSIVLVSISDMVFGDAVDTFTVWSIMGCSAIVLAFGILAYDMVRGR
ncbi:hypothetical protein K466DRAFT_572494 [Polyporus arcularius HHB13444]|uniref:EamA domain-containing protein n=1 Tax=Polyporus arcularius HHB13444 TaxID=1314778 RepID=A0A5C3PXG5_9APHY|nr:hypothetical protein K466DRAFT_572494 [Polyporus arcularius HHB13444]